MLDAWIRFLCTRGRFKRVFSAMTRPFVTFAGQKLGVQAHFSDAQRHVALTRNGLLEFAAEFG